MSQINNVPQPQIGGSELQQAQAADKPNVAPRAAGLGSQHSVGKTIARVVLAILTLGISEAVRGIIRACKSEVAPAVPHLPANQQRNATTNIAQANAQMIERFTSGDAAIMGIVERAKSKTMSIFGDQFPLNEETFKTAMQRGMGRVGRELLTENALEALAEKTSRTMMNKALLVDLLGKVPLNASLTAQRKNLLAEGILSSPEGRALALVNSEEELAPVIVKLMDKLNAQAVARVTEEACKAEIMTAGLQKFSEMTGLAPGSFTLDTWPLENKMNMTVGDIHDRFKTPEKPYPTASKEAIMSEWQPRADRFFIGRAQAYTSIATLDIPANFKSIWQSRCLTNMDIEADTPVNSVAIADKFKTDNSLSVLLDPDVSVADKLQVMEAFAAIHSTTSTEIFGSERLSKMGPDGRAAIAILSFEAIFAQRQDLVEGLRARPELVKTLETAIQEKTSAAMRDPALNKSEITSIMAANELFGMLKLQINPGN